MTKRSSRGTEVTRRRPVAWYSFSVGEAVEEGADPGIQGLGVVLDPFIQTPDLVLFSGGRPPAVNTGVQWGGRRQGRRWLIEIGGESSPQIVAAGCR